MAPIAAIIKAKADALKDHRGLKMRRSKRKKPTTAAVHSSSTTTSTTLVVQNPSSADPNPAHGDTTYLSRARAKKQARRAKTRLSKNLAQQQQQRDGRKPSATERKAARDPSIITSGRAAKRKAHKQRVKYRKSRIRDEEKEERQRLQHIEALEKSRPLYYVTPDGRLTM
ncbi:MAG: hypothetical protein Q9191_007591 [Dirinaria sp. TL-2023a]